MKATLKLLLPGIVAVVILLWGCATTATVDSGTFKAEVDAIFAKYMAANLDKDVDAYLSLWVDNPIKMKPQKPAVVFSANPLLHQGHETPPVEHDGSGAWFPGVPIAARVWGHLIQPFALRQRKCFYRESILSARSGQDRACLGAGAFNPLMNRK